MPAAVPFDDDGSARWPFRNRDASSTTAGRGGLCPNNRPADLETVWAWHEACSDLNQAPPAVVGLLVAVLVVVSAAGSWLPGPG